MLPMFLINGEYQQHINIQDRGFQYGDGLFETLEFIQGKAVFLDRHLSRLTLGCKKLGIPYPEQALLEQDIIKLNQSDSRSVLKIIITRGIGGRGYRPAESIQPTRVLSLHPYPIYPETHYQLGISACFCLTQLGLNPGLAGLKHMNRLEQVLARAEWRDDSVQEGIMLDTNNHVIEGTFSNLFYVKNSQVYTALLTHAGVAGITRQIILELLAFNGIKVTESFFDKQEFLEADEIFFCNSIIGIWPVKQLADRAFQIGPVTRAIQHWYAEFRNKAINGAD